MKPESGKIAISGRKYLRFLGNQMADVFLCFQSYHALQIFSTPPLTSTLLDPCPTYAVPLAGTLQMHFVLPFALLSLLIVICTRLISILPSFSYQLTRLNKPKANNTKTSAFRNVRMMALLGSGGHTSEMLRLLGQLDLSNYRLTWVVSEGDKTSLTRARALEKDRKRDLAPYIVLARARKVGEPLFLSVISALRSFASTASQLCRAEIPEILLINGPGTCVPVAYVLFFLRFLGIGRTRIIYVESLARVKGLSLSGKLTLPLADRFIVQWRPLAEKYHRAEYYGILV